MNEHQNEKIELFDFGSVQLKSQDDEADSSKFSLFS